MKYILIIVCLLAITQKVSAQKTGIEKSGDILQIALPVGAALFSIYPKKDYQGLLNLTKSYATTLALTYSIKYAVNATRPISGKQSFPSGHTSSAFSGAAFMHHRYGWEYGLPSYALATWVGFSRVNAGRHYIHDVLAGATLAVCVSNCFIESKVAVIPVLTDDITGIDFQINF